MDLTSIKTIRSLQERFGFRFSKSFGQNFLTSSDVLERIADAAEINGGALEIGPGFGVLTAELAKRADKVVALEIDPTLLPVLDYTLAEFDNVKIINADVMKTDLAELVREEFQGKISVAANLPYYITTPVITRLLESELPADNITVMVQKEVADRLAAAPGKKDYGAVSVFCRYYADCEIVTTVSAGCFVPAPKVDSAVVRMRLRGRPPARVADKELFFRTVRAAFSQRRKTLSNCLSSGFGLEKSVINDALTSIGIDPKRRGETLSFEEFADAADRLGALLNA